MPNYTLGQIRSDGLPFAMEYLMAAVVGNTDVTYGRIATLLEADLGLSGRIFSVQVGEVVGALMDRLHEVGDHVPLINVLVINQTTGRPGVGVDGYLRQRFGVTDDPLPRELKSRLVAEASREVYHYGHCDKVYRKAFGRPAPTVEAAELVTGTERDGLPAAPVARRGGEAESREHKALKAYVLAHPACLHPTDRPVRAVAELPLMSGDEVDVCFETADRVDLGEVKSIRSDWKDLRRGVYQCVKYRAVFQAQRQQVTQDMRIITTLVLEEEPPADIRALARRNDVSLKVVSVNRLKR